MKPAAACRTAVLVVVMGALAACSGIKTYPNTLARNLYVDVKADPGVRVSLDVYRIDAQCEADYEGTVALDNGRTEVGIANDAWSYLTINFARSSVFKGKSKVSRGTLIKPRIGKVYRVDALYKNDMYNVEFREAASQNAKGAEMKPMGIDDCRAQVKREEEKLSRRK